MTFDMQGRLVKTCVALLLVFVVHYARSIIMSKKEKHVSSHARSVRAIDRRGGEKLPHPWRDELRRLETEALQDPAWLDRLAKSIQEDEDPSSSHKG